MPLSAEDRMAIAETIARYCHATDAGDGQGVAEQFTEDGILEITGAWQARGYDQIKQIGDFPNKPKHWINSIVIDGNGSTATSRVYYAAIRGSGPLLATGRYDSRLTKQFNGQWKLVHHCYTGDPVEGGGGRRGSQTDSEALTAEDRMLIIETIARLNTALRDKDADKFIENFTSDGVFKYGEEAEITGHGALAGMIAEMPATPGHYWTTNYIIEGTGTEANLRAYFALVQGDSVTGTGMYEDRMIKEEGCWKIARHHYVPDEQPA